MSISKKERKLLDEVRDMMRFITIGYIGTEHTVTGLNPDFAVKYRFPFPPCI